MNTIGSTLKLTSYGESHGSEIGAILDGFPPNWHIDIEAIQYEMNRRRPGQSKLTTPRDEEDKVIFTSGIFEKKTTGAPIHLVIKNQNQKPKDYSHLKNIFRPSHADFTYQEKYGIRDFRGGGRSSARITAGWVAAGALCKQYLIERENIAFNTFVTSIGNTEWKPSYSDIQKIRLKDVESSIVRCPNKEASSKMEATISEAIENRDSLGGVISGSIQHMPIGLGDPLFRKINATLAQVFFSINAVKGVEFGGGFEMSKKYGSEVNDSFFVDSAGKPQTKTNFSGGIQGGISNGSPITFRVAFKPTATIGKPQETFSSDKENVILEASGRHDPCVVPRAVAIVENLAAFVILDHFLTNKKYQ